MTEEIYISWEDLKKVYLKQRSAIGRLVLYSILLSLLYLLLRPISYQAQATFKQSFASTQEGFDFRNLLRNFSARTHEGSAIPIMLSRTVLGSTVEEIGLQLEIDSSGKLAKMGKRLKDNLLAAWGKKPLDRDDFEFRKASYLGDWGRCFYLKFSSPENFDLLDHNRQFLCKGRTHQVTAYETLHFTLIKTPASLQLGKFYPLTCPSLEQVVTKLRSKILIKPLKDERSILTISFAHPSRQKAALFVNTLMNKYEEFLNLQNYAIIRAQLGYLEKRQEELQVKWDREIQEHTAALQKNLSAEGFLTSEEAATSIFEPLQDFQNRLNEIEVEIAGLEKKRSSIQGSQLLHQFKESVLAAKTLQELDKVDLGAMTLPTCRTLYQSYCHQLDDLHAQMKQVVYFQGHLHEPHFEISTLCNVLTDSVTQQLVHKSTELESRLCDLVNHSSREQERLQETVATHKRFLGAHLTQTLQLGKIRIHLLQEKLHSLQTVMHRLLEQEKTVLESKIGELKNNLQSIPALWQIDKKLKFRAELTKGMMEGLTQITESKNLSQNLYQVESKPLDPALTPYSPLPPQLLFKSTLVGIAVFVLSYLFFSHPRFFPGPPRLSCNSSPHGSRNCWHGFSR